MFRAPRHGNWRTLSVSVATPWHTGGQLNWLRCYAIVTGETSEQARGIIPALIATMNNQNPDTTLRQIQTMRTALESAGRSTMAAQETAAQAMTSLKIERHRTSQLLTALEQAITRAEEAEAENLRLRKLAGGMCAQNDSLTRDLRDLLRDVRAGSPIARLPAGLNANARGHSAAA